MTFHSCDMQIPSRTEFNLIFALHLYETYFIYRFNMHDVRKDTLCFITQLLEQEAQLSLTNCAQLSLTNCAMLFCKVVEVLQDFLS